MDHLYLSMQKLEKAIERNYLDKSKRLNVYNLIRNKFNFKEKEK